MTQKRTRYAERLIHDYAAFEPGEIGIDCKRCNYGEEILEPLVRNGFTLDGSRPALMKTRYF